MKDLTVKVSKEGIMRFFVTSEHKRRMVYLVDLLEHGGVGECSCPHWHCRIWPKVKIGQLTLEMAAGCKHIEAARQFMIRETLAALAATHQTHEQLS